MPVLEVHLVEGDHSPAQHTRLLAVMSRRCAEILDFPLERIRAYVTLHPRGLWAVGGETGTEPAPYVTAIVLEGRPQAQRRRLLDALTDVLVDELGVTRSRVRGRIIPISPDDWGL